ncbi:MAG: hypothetical protein LW834_13980 [Cyanobium sp. 49614_E6]|jgi:hypothetical protein|nr:hypothetical protein [Cyanobium sp. 49614_E6]
MARGGDRIGNLSGNLSGNIGRRPGRDRFDIAQPLNSSVYPRKGKGYGVQGEAAYPDLLDHWDKLASWQSWRKGMSLARSQLIGAAERWSAIEVLHRDSYAATPSWRSSQLLLAGFTSSQSPEGRWTVAIQPRGTEISRQPVGGNQREFFYHFPDEPERPPLRLLEVKANLVALTGGGLPLHFNRMLIGEVLEDSAINFRQLADDPTDGLGLLCVAVHEEQGLAYFDASRCWRRERTADGRLINREIQIPPDAPLPTFRPARHLTQALTLSCNCPSHLGLEFAALRSGERLGGQNLFPQRAPSGLGGPRRSSGEGSPEGVRRRFAELPWDRIPGRECKHCHAVRWALGVPMAEPSDMPSPDSNYWRELSAMAQLEDMAGPMNQPWFLERLRDNLLDEQALSMLDATLLAACVGDAVGIVPQRVPLIPVQVAAAAPTPLLIPAAGPLRAGATPLPYSNLGVLRINEQHPSSSPDEDLDAVFGDWWTGRGTATEVLAFDGPAQVHTAAPAIRPLPPNTPLPRVLP